MTKLLRLEYILNRRQVLITVAIFSLFFLYMASRIDSSRVYLVMVCLMLGLALPFGILGREDKFKTASLVCSLPVRRSTVVLAKYAATWIVIGAGIAYSVVLTAVLPFAKVPVGELLTLKSLLVSLFLISLLFGFILPFTIRFGLTGIIVFLVSTQVLGIVALLSVQLLGSRGNPIRTAIRAVEGGLRDILYHPATSGFLLTMAAAVLAVNAISFFTARALYLRRDL
jgi:ABC-type transport system involved in multi-copper enzyme maturation permease subunit